MPQSPDLKERLVQYALLARMHQPIGSLLLLWPTLWALWIAGEGEPDAAVVVVFVVGVFVMRSAGCVINDFADRRVDPHVRRTMHRPIASGKVEPGEALGLFVALCLVAFALVLTLNRLAVLYSFAGAALAASYPFMKRWTYLPQIHLGVAFGWGIPMAFAALTDAVPPLAWLLLAGVVAWAVVYDTMYAMVDREDDLRVGVKSTRHPVRRRGPLLRRCKPGRGARGPRSRRPSGRSRRCLLLRGGARHAPVRLPAAPHPRPRARCLLQGVPEQQLGGRRGLRRHRRRLRLAVSAARAPECSLRARLAPTFGRPGGIGCTGRRHGGRAPVPRPHREPEIGGVGAGCQTRTGDLMLTRQLLYQLS